MTIYTDPIAAAPAFTEALVAAERILILSHINPDGDAIGSMLGLWHALRSAGKQPTALASSPLPGYVAPLPGAEVVQRYQPGAALPPADLIWMVDTADLPRIGERFHAEHGAAIAARPLLIVDHHVTNNGGGTLNLIQPEAASCAELLYALLRAMRLPIGSEAATCLLLGITTDTQSFQTSSTGPAALRAAADLVALGASHRLVIDAIYNSVPPTSLHLVGLGLGAMQREDGLLWTAVTQEMMRATNAEDEAGDELVRLMQRAEGARLIALFKERRDGTVKLSLRSRAPIDVAAIAGAWGGGGHTRAAGATIRLPLGEAQAEVLPALRAAIAAAD